MHIKTVIVSACVTMVPGLALAGGHWTETYKGMGSDSSRENACSAANSSASMSAAAACVARMGSSNGQTDQGCSCQCNPVGDSQICTCTDTIQVSCASNR